MTTKTKRCSRCQLEKPLTEFHRNKRMADGHAQYCKSCQRLAAREYYLRHGDYVRAKVAEYREQNPEKVREQKRRDYERHADDYKRRAKRWAREHRQRNLANKRRYRRERPEVWQRNNALRRARKKGAEILGEVDFDAVLARDGAICWICGKPVGAAEISFDHAVPLSKGGEHSTRNIRVAHRFCNYSKHDKTISHQMYLL